VTKYLKRIGKQKDLFWLTASEASTHHVKKGVFKRREFHIMVSRKQKERDNTCTLELSLFCPLFHLGPSSMEMVTPTFRMVLHSLFNRLCK
jgi:hypothetical protein